MIIIEPEEFYSPQQIERFQWVPSRTLKGKFATRESIVKEIEQKKLKAVKRDKSVNGRYFTLIIGKDLIEYIKKYYPDYEIPLG